MAKKAKLTDQLKTLEVEAYEMRVELKALQHKIQINYDYEAELHGRVLAAKNKSSSLQVEFYKKTNEIRMKIDEMKNVMDVFTGNFYTE